MYLLEIKNLNKKFGGVTALDDFSCVVHPGEILGLIGPNGAGKTTLFNVITCFIPCDSGAVTFNGRKILGKESHHVRSAGIARTFQQLRLIHQITVLENVLLSSQAQPGENLSNTFFRPSKCITTEKKNREQALSCLEPVGLQDKAHDQAGSLSYGQQKLLTFACCTASKPQLMLLDEPVSGISPALTEKMLGMIREQSKSGRTIVMIEHNMDVVWGLCGRVVFMDTGRKISEGKPEEVKNDPKVIEAYLD